MATTEDSAVICCIARFLGVAPERVNPDSVLIREFNIEHLVGCSGLAMFLEEELEINISTENLLKMQTELLTIADIIQFCKN